MTDRIESRVMWGHQFPEDMTRDELIVALKSAITENLYLYQSRIETAQRHRELAEARRNSGWFGWLFR